MWNSSKMEEVGLRAENQKTFVDPDLTPVDKLADDDALYHPSEAKLSYQGHIYQLQVLMSSLIRAFKLNYEFGLATEVKEAKQFDDLIFRVKDGSGTIKYFLMQVKHRWDENKMLPYSKLLGSSKKNRQSGFNLLEYFKSYYEIRKNHKCFGKVKNLLLYTNVTLDFDEIERHGVTFKSVGHENEVLYHKPIKEKIPAIYQIEEFSEELLQNFENAHPTLEITKNDISEFLGLMRFAIHQPNKDEFDDIIKNEMAETFGLFQSEAITDSLYLYMWRWMMSKNVEFLRKEFIKKFFDKVKEDWQKIKIFGVTTDNLEKDLRFGDFFQDVSDANEWINSQSAIVQIISSTGTALPFIKTVQFLKNKWSILNYAAVNVECLLCRFDDYISLLKSNSPFILVVEVKPVKGEVEAQLLAFLDKYLSIRHKDQSLIILSENDNSHIQTNVKKTYDACSFDELTQKTQKRLLTKKVLFMGDYIQMKHLLHLNHSEFITGDVLNSLVVGNEVKVGVSLPNDADIEDVYIPRKFHTRMIFRTECLTDKSEHDLFIIENTTKREILSLVPEEKVCDYQDISSSKVTSRIIVMQEFKNEYLSKIKKFYCDKNIHVLRRYVDVFIWLSSEGVCNECSEIDILQQWGRTKISIIAGEAGLGKTNVMLHMAHQAKKSMPSSWIIYLSLRELAHILSERYFSDSQCATDFLKSVLNSSFEQQLFIHRLMNVGKISLLLDGYDELSQTNKSMILILIKALLNTKVEQIWVTTRSTTDYELLSLSESLYTLSPFSDDDQKEYIKKFYKRINNSINEGFLSEFSNKFVNSLNESPFDYVRHVLTVPMHAKMVADFYLNNSECRSNVKSLTETLQKKHFDLVEIYKQFIIKKCSTFFKTRLDKEILNLYILPALLKAHGIIALRNFFPKDAERFIKKFSDVYKYTDHIEGIGLVRYVNGEWIFSHHSYCKYFVACAIFNESSEVHKSALSNNLSFLKEELLKESSDTMRRFLDFMIAEESEVHLAVMKGDLHKIKQLYINDPLIISKRDLFQRTPMHLAALYNHRHICNFLVKNEYGLIIALDIFGFSALCYAVASDDISTIRFIYALGRTTGRVFKKIIKNFYNTYTCRPSKELFMQLFVLCYIDPSFKAAIFGTIDYITKFTEFYTRTQFQEIPEFYTFANNDQKWEMLSLNDFEPITMALKNKRSKVLMEMSTLDTPMKKYISSLKEFEQAFDLSVKQNDYSMLMSLHKLASDTRTKELWRNSYYTVFKHIIENCIMNSEAIEVVHNILRLFACKIPLTNVNVGAYFKKLLQEKCDQLSKVFSFATVKQQWHIFRAVQTEWIESFKISFENGRVCDFECLLNCIPEKNDFLRKTLLNEIKYTDAFKNAIIKHNSDHLEKLATCNKKEIKCMRKALEDIEWVPLFKEVLLHKDYESFTNYLLKFTFMSERKQVLSVVHPRSWKRRGNNYKHLSFHGDAEEYQKMASDLDEVIKPKWSIWAKFLYVVAKNYGGVKCYELKFVL